MISRPRILYISYLGILEPIPQSQVLPYILKLSEHFDFVLLSYEKKYLQHLYSETQKKIDAKLQKNGIRWIRRRYHKYPLIASSFYDIFLGILHAGYLVRKHRIQIIHARSNIPIAIGFVLKFFFNIKLIYDRRGILGEDHLETSGWKKGGWLHRSALWFEKKALQTCDATVVLTHRMHDHLRSRPETQTSLIRTIPCCVDLSTFDIRQTTLSRLQNLKQKFVFTYAGSVGTYNIIEEMLFFIQIASQYFANTHLLMLTHQPERAWQQIRSKSLVSENQITVVSAPHEEVSQYLAHAHVGLIFRKHSPTALAASPTKFAEYLACGLAIVSFSEIGDNASIIQNHSIGVTFSAYDETHYRKALIDLRTLFQNPVDLKKRCRRTAEQYFSLDQGAQNYLELYRQIL